MPLRLMVSRHSVFYSPFICTTAAGFLAKEGLTATYDVLAPGDTWRKAILEGRANLLQSSVSASWKSIEREDAEFPVHIAQINSRDGFILAARRPDPDFEWKKLEGKTLLADHGGQPFAMLRYSLQQHGVDLSRIRLVDAGTPGKIELAFRAGGADYVHLQAPTPHQLECDGAGAIVAYVAAGLPACAFSSVCCARDYVETPDYQGFLRAFAASKQWVQASDPREVAEAEQDYFPGVSIEALTAAVAGYQRLGNWKGGVEIPRGDYEQSLNIFEASGAVARRHPYDAVCLVR
jgi:NitT/TauT family transport system substrate-binding protein